MPRASVIRPETMRPGGVIGIDPGRSSGGIAYVFGKTAFTWALSTMTDRDIWELIADISRRACLGVLEKVHAMPAQGVSSTFKFGVSFGELKMALVASGVRFELVTPLKWQTALSCRSKGDKNVTKQKAQELFPDVRVTHAVADALLIAEYGRRFLK